MKPYRNETAPRPISLIVCVLLLVALPGTATASSLFMQQAPQQQGDDNGRSAAQQTQRVAVPAQTTPAKPYDVWRGSDQDDGQPVGRADTPQPVAETPRLLTLPASMRVEATAPANSFRIAEDGNVGIGIAQPLGRLHVVARPSPSDAPGRDLLLLDDHGNLEIGGLLTEASSRLLKENFVVVDGAAVLARLAQMPVMTWNYTTDDDAIRHMGPVAQDFYAAFGLGADEAHLAPLDVNGVSLAAIQALTRQLSTQAAQIEALETQNAALLKRLDALEARSNQ